MEGEALGLEMGLRRHCERGRGEGGGKNEIPREDEFGTLLVRRKVDKALIMIRLDVMRSNREAEIAECDDDTQ